MTLEMTQTSPSPSDSSSTSLSETSTAAAVTTIRQKQIIHPGGFNSEDVYLLDGIARDMVVPIFGAINMAVKYTPVEELDDADLRDRLKVSGITEVIQEISSNAASGWSSVLTWGFEEVDGARRFTQNNVMKRDGKTLTGRLVYDYKDE
jgi:hypothetical protein